MFLVLLIETRLYYQNLSYRGKNSVVSLQYLPANANVMALLT